MLQFLGPIISGIGSLLGGLVGVVKSKIDARRAIQLAEMIKDVKMAGIETDAETIIAIERLKRRNVFDQILSAVVLISLYAPFVCGLIWPDATVSYFVNVVAKFPDWYIMLFVTISVAHWGIRRLTRI